MGSFPRKSLKQKYIYQKRRREKDKRKKGTIKEKMERKLDVQI